MLAGLLGVPLGSILAQKLRVRYHQADPLICAVGLLISVPLIFFAVITADSNATLCYILIFFGQLALNLTWSIVADILLVNYFINYFFKIKKKNLTTIFLIINLKF